MITVPSRSRSRSIVSNASDELEIHRHDVKPSLGEPHRLPTQPLRFALSTNAAKRQHPRFDSPALREGCGRSAKYLKSLADPIRFERTTSAFGGQRSIQLSYGSISATGRTLLQS